MIALDKALRLQAWVDGELDSIEAREVEAWVGRDPEAQALADSLRTTHAVLSVTEMKLAVPETREFYWSKIAQGVALEERRKIRETTAASAVAWWRTWLLPASALAAVLVIVPMSRWMSLPQETAALGLEHEIDTPLENVSSFTFRSESERMTVVWVDFDSR